MTQKGFEDYLYAVFDYKNGTAKSYIMAISIIDDMFDKKDVFHLEGKSLTCLNDEGLLAQILDYTYKQQKLFRDGKESIFSYIKENQISYAKKSFCSAAIKSLIDYCKYDTKEQEANRIIEQSANSRGANISNALISCFNINKVGKDKTVETRVRLGQSYFRKMVLANYEGKCCVTGLDVQPILRASHIVAWAEDKRNRMNPENGLCLSATYDAAFDKHLISFDEDFRMIVSKEIREHYSNQVVKDYFERFAGKKIILPKQYKPSQKLLEKHRNLLVL